MGCTDSDEVRYYMKRPPGLEILENLTTFMKLIQLKETEITRGSNVSFKYLIGKKMVGLKNSRPNF